MDSDSVAVKQEIEDEEVPTEYVIVGRDGLEGLEFDDNHQLVQLAQANEDGQIVFQVIEQNQESMGEEHEGQEAVDDTPKQHETPNKRGGRKRKNTATIDPSMTPSRPKRMVVPNIKSEFVYDTITSSHAANAAVAAATAASESNNNATSEDHVDDEEHEGNGTTYTLVQDGDMITAWQTLPDGQIATNGENDDDDSIVKNGDDTISHNDQNNNQEDGIDDDESYPSEYTPTNKAKKGRINPPKEDDSALRRFPCPFQGCTYIAKYRSNLWDHKKTHTGEKPYICSWPSCTMRFSQTHQLKLHLRSHTGERPYICIANACLFPTSQKPGLKSHMLTHTGEKPFKCDFPGCGWSFRLKGALTDHKRAIHENAKKHVCEWPGCNKRFLQHCHLKKHIMGHADIKPFSCDWPNCNYKAVTMAYVTNHRKTHTGEKNYECTYPNCNKRFVKSSHVNRHRQRCHPDLFMCVEDGNEQIIDGMEDEEDEDNQNTYALQEVVHPPRRTRRNAAKQSQQNQQIVYMKAANENGEEDEEEGATTYYIQSEDVEEEMVSDGMAQFINGSVVTSEAGEQFIISTNPEGDVQATPIMIQLKEENTDIVI